MFVVFKGLPLYILAIVSGIWPKVLPGGFFYGIGTDPDPLFAGNIMTVGGFSVGLMLFVGLDLLIWLVDAELGGGRGIETPSL